MYTLLGADGRPYPSENRGTLGGNSQLRIYGQLDCWSARNALGKGYARPCGHCMRDEYRAWKARR